MEFDEFLAYVRKRQQRAKECDMKIKNEKDMEEDTITAKEVIGNPIKKMDDSILKMEAVKSNDEPSLNGAEVKINGEEKNIKDELNDSENRSEINGSLVIENGAAHDELIESDDVEEEFRLRLDEDEEETEKKDQSTEITNDKDNLETLEKSEDVSEFKPLQICNVEGNLEENEALIEEHHSQGEDEITIKDEQNKDNEDEKTKADDKEDNDSLSEDLDNLLEVTTDNIENDDNDEFDPELEKEIDSMGDSNDAETDKESSNDIREIPEDDENQDENKTVEEVDDECKMADEVVDEIKMANKVVDEMEMADEVVDEIKMAEDITEENVMEDEVAEENKIGDQITDENQIENSEASPVENKVEDDIDENKMEDDIDENKMEDDVDDKMEDDTDENKLEDDNDESKTEDLDIDEHKIDDLDIDEHKLDDDATKSDQIEDSNKESQKTFKNVLDTNNDSSNMGFETRDDVVEEIDKMLETGCETDKSNKEEEPKETQLNVEEKIEYHDESIQTKEITENKSLQNLNKNTTTQSIKEDLNVVELMETDSEDKKDDNAIPTNSNAVKSEVKEEKPDTKGISKISLKRKSVDEFNLNEFIKIDTKKPKMETKPDKIKFDTLADFKEYFKSGIRKMNRKTLEDFCIQKMCDVIGQTSDLGKLRHQLSVQEEFIKAYKTKVASLTKQLKDLDIVKGRIIHDLKRLENRAINDLVPVKITRSVGLQVCLNQVKTSKTPTQPNNQIPVETQNYIGQARRSLPTKPAATQRTPQKPIQKVTTPPKLLPQKTPQVNQKVVQQRNPQPSQSILNKVLQQKSPAPKPVNTTPKAVAPKPVAPKAVIDLTDEEDTARSKPAVLTPGQNIRVVHQLPVSSAQLTTNQNPNLVTTSVQANRLAYVVNGQGQGQQLITLAPTATGTPPRPGFKNIMLKPINATAISPRQMRPNTMNLQPVTVVTSQALQRGSVRFAVAPLRQVAPQQQPQVSHAQPRQIQPMSRQMGPRSAILLRHPAPLPAAPPVQPSQPHWKGMPPRPSLKISRCGDGIVLSWRILIKDLSPFAEIASYQLFAYQENNSTPSTDMWRKVGDVKALALPMACTLTQFKAGNKYHFAVRAVDVHSRVGPFSQPEEITLT